IADGVSTSFGSRFAACAAVRSAVRFLAEHASENTDQDDAEMLRGAGKHAQQVVTASMQYAIATPTDETWNAIRGLETLPKSSATRLMENTLTRAMPSLGPAFAATLIAGVVRPPNSRAPGCLTVIRIGDGSVEIGKRGAARSSLFTVDNEETIISSALC